MKMKPLRQTLLVKASIINLALTKGTRLTQLGIKNTAHKDQPKLWLKNLSDTLGAREIPALTQFILTV